MPEEQKKKHKTFAILNCVVDQLYDADGVNHDNMEAFLKSLPSVLGHTGMETPRAGDTILLSQSHLKEAASRALGIQDEFNAAALKDIFGTPKLAPGGSLANTIATIAASQKGGKALSETRVLSILDDGEAGQVFKNSYPDGVVLEDVVDGECLTVHVVPYDGDRSQFPTFSDTNASTKGLSTHIFGHLQKGEYDTVMFEGFMSDSPNFESDYKTLLTAIGAANMQREMMGLEPTHLVITAGAQHVCNNPAFREFVKEATKLTRVSVHANTGEFRRLIDNDEQWRVNAQKDFVGLEGRDLEKAKRGSTEYRAAKSAANIDSIQKVMSEWGADTDFDLELVVTDGPNPGYVVNNDHYIEVTPEPLDPATIVNKVGAGDAFMAFYRLARQLGLSQDKSMKAGGIGATHTLQQEEARPTVEDHSIIDWHGYEGPVKLLAMNGLLGPDQFTAPDTAISAPGLAP